MEIILPIIVFVCVIAFIIRNPAPANNKRQSKTYIDEYGYRRFTDSGKLVHRWVMEKKLGRKLRPEEVVHHKNRNKRDNSPENLEVFANQEEHQKHHNKTDFWFKLLKWKMFQ